MRLIVLIGASASQPRGHPVLVERVEGRELDLGQPFRRRHVAVEAGNDQAGREPVFERGAARRSSPRRPARRGRRAPRRGSRTCSRRSTADDLGRRGRCRPRPADRRDAPSQRAVPTRPPPISLDTQVMVMSASIGHGREVRVVELDLPVDHAGDFQAPGLGRHLRHGQCGVDAVEVALGVKSGARRRPRATLTAAGAGGGGVAGLGGSTDRRARGLGGGEASTGASVRRWRGPRDTAPRAPAPSSTAASRSGTAVLVSSSLDDSAPPGGPAGSAGSAVAAVTQRVRSPAHAPRRQPPQGARPCRSGEDAWAGAAEHGPRSAPSGERSGGAHHVTSSPGARRRDPEASSHGEHADRDGVRRRAATPMPTSRAILSFVPNHSIARSFSRARHPEDEPIADVEHGRAESRRESGDHFGGSEPDSRCDQPARARRGGCPPRPWDVCVRVGGRSGAAGSMDSVRSRRDAGSVSYWAALAAHPQGPRLRTLAHDEPCHDRCATMSQVKPLPPSAPRCPTHPATMRSTPPPPHSEQRVAVLRGGVRPAVRPDRLARVRRRAACGAQPRHGRGGHAGGLWRALETGSARRAPAPRRRHDLVLDARSPPSGGPGALGAVTARPRPARGCTPLPGGAGGRHRRWPRTRPGSDPGASGPRRRRAPSRPRRRPYTGPRREAARLPGGRGPGSTFRKATVKTRIRDGLIKLRDLLGEEP